MPGYCTPYCSCIRLDVNKIELSAVELAKLLVRRAATRVSIVTVATTAA